MSETPPPPTPVRVSTPAAVGMALSIGSSVACLALAIAAAGGSRSLLGAIVVLPIVGFLGAALGGWGLLQIRASQGAMIGRGAAIIAIFLGLMSGVTQGAFAVGALAYVSGMKELAVNVDRMLQAAQAGRLGEARRVMHPGASGAVDDESLRTFTDRLRADVGTIRGASASLSLILEARRMLAERASAGAQPPPSSAQHRPPTPVRISGGRASAIAWVFLDQSALDAKRIEITDMIVLLPSGGAAVLQRDGPARQAAGWMGVEVTDAVPPQ